MIDSVLKIIDRIIKLVQIREGRLSRRFEEIHKPIMTDFRIVHADYIEIFENTLRILEGKNTSYLHSIPLVSRILSPESVRLSRALRYLEEARRKYSSVRGRLYNIPFTISMEQYCREEKEFLSCVFSYFPSFNNALDHQLKKFYLENKMKNTIFPIFATPNTASLSMVTFMDFAIINKNNKTNEIKREMAGILNDFSRASQIVESSYIKLGEKLPGK